VQRCAVDPYTTPSYAKLGAASAEGGARRRAVGAMAHRGDHGPERDALGEPLPGSRTQAMPLHMALQHSLRKARRCPGASTGTAPDRLPEKKSERERRLAAATSHDAAIIGHTRA